MSGIPSGSSADALGRRRRFGVALLAVGLVLYAIHDRALSVVANEPGAPRILGLAIGIVCPAGIVTGLYLLIAAPKSSVRRRRSGARPHERKE